MHDLSVIHSLRSLNLDLDRDAFKSVLQFLSESKGSFVPPETRCLWLKIFPHCHQPATVRSCVSCFLRQSFASTSVSITSFLLGGVYQWIHAAFCVALCLGGSKFLSAVGKYKTLKERGRKCWFCNDTGGRTILTANLAMAFFLPSQAESLYNISVIGASEGFILIKPSLSWIMHLWTLSLQAGDKAFI